MQAPGHEHHGASHKAPGRTSAGHFALADCDAATLHSRALAACRWHGPDNTLWHAVHLHAARITLRCSQPAGRLYQPFSRACVPNPAAPCSSAAAAADPPRCTPRCRAWLTSIDSVKVQALSDKLAHGLRAMQLRAVKHAAASRLSSYRPKHVLVISPDPTGLV